MNLILITRISCWLFFALQQPNDEMIDGYVLKPDFTWNDTCPYYSDAAPEHVGFKNTVETDQETSLIQIVGKYIRKTGDKSILQQDVAGRTVMNRMEGMVDYLLRERYNEEYGLLFGAMTADWGDVQPNDDFGCDFNELSSRAIDVYDNAMFIIALDYLKEMSDDASAKTKWQNLRDKIAQNVRKHLWDDAKLRKMSANIFGTMQIRSLSRIFTLTPRPFLRVSTKTRFITTAERLSQWRPVCFRKRKWVS